MGSDQGATAAGAAEASVEPGLVVVVRSDESKGKPNPTEHLVRNITAAGAIAVVLFALIKTYAAANYSLTTAAALLSNAPLSILLGSLASYDYELFPALWLFCFTVAAAVWRREGPGILVAALLSIGVLSLAISPLVYILWFGGIYAVVLAVHGFARWVSAEPDQVASSAPARWFGWSRSLAVRLEPSRARMARADSPTILGLRRFARSSYRLLGTYFVLALIWMIVSTLNRAWLPAEVIDFTAPTGNFVTVGYVVSADETWTTIMRADDRVLMWQRSDGVTSRTLCHLTGEQSPGHKPLYYGTKPYESKNRSCLRVARGAVADATIVCGSLPNEVPIVRDSQTPRNKVPCELPR